ncbi:predicted protein [Uncinocarpus reesii 1704]|uniref:Uncharacterized protein n=1 Tax=Uncinocarpus reesii (strain UAMH 1704) TaxID=336963 RepID=C4JIE9_UNCRE|nr:uncharacterized protein UREG_01486 [Uncinocarpus reesii 1704]EEP76637.1 predicted protein [Uncinocarpus reesii 1704]
MLTYTLLYGSALRIVSERATKGPTRDLLLEDLSSGDPTRRHKALNALHFLVSSRPQEHIEENSTTISPILPKTRPLGENKALATLCALLPDNVTVALEAGVINRWLAKYPFPCKAEPEKNNVVVYMRIWSADDPLMSSIVGTLATHREGVRQLRRHGLMGSRMEEHKHDIFVPRNEHYEALFPINRNPERDEDSDSDIWMLNGEDTAGAQPWTWERPQMGPTTDQALRRRRREAMVFSEGGGPLDRGNIIEPREYGNFGNRLADDDLDVSAAALMSYPMGPN